MPANCILPDWRRHGLGRRAVNRPGARFLRVPPRYRWPGTPWSRSGNNSSEHEKCEEKLTYDMEL